MSSTTPLLKVCYLSRKGETTGPYTREQVLSMWDQGILTADTEFCWDRGGAWLPVKNLVKKRSSSRFWRTTRRIVLVTIFVLVAVFAWIFAEIDSEIRAHNRAARREIDRRAAEQREIDEAIASIRTLDDQNRVLEMLNDRLDRLRLEEKEIKRAAAAKRARESRN